MPSFVKSICLGLALLAAGPTHTVACYAFGDNDLLNLGSTPFLAQSTLQYGFDGGSQGGLGLRTSINLTGNQTGTNAATYGTSPQLGNQLSGFSTTGSVSGPLGTPVSQSFDGMGQVGTRQPDGTTDTMTWDALGRLMAVSRRNSGTGFNWSAIYDGLGRRLQTSQQTVTGGTPTGSALVIQSSYDPDIEFLELGVTVTQNGSSVRDWLVHGPDLNGIYGGLHGTGGVEAVYNGTSHVTTGIVSDLYGHAEATVANNVTTTWNAVHSDGYGPFPGSANTPVPISASQDVSAVLAWHGKYVDGTGYYYLGARYYAPDSGTFLSCDPAGHAASMDLYSYCNGDPVNSFDPDGRFGTQANAGSSGGLDDYLASRDRQFQALVDQTERAGTTGPAPSQAEQESQTLNAIPLVGSLKMLGEGITGYDAVTGQYLSTSQQLGNAALGAVGILPAGALEDSLLHSPFANKAAAESVTTPIGELRSAGLADAHHVIQDAAVRDLKGYDTNLAPGVQLQGPSTAIGSPHYLATQAQRAAGGGTYGAERQIAIQSLNAAGYTDAQAAQALQESDAYFKSIGVTDSTVTRIPGNRRSP